MVCYNSFSIIQELISSKPPNNFCLKVILRDTYNLITSHFVRIKVVTNKNLGFKTSLKMIRFDAKSHENTIYLLSEGKETEKNFAVSKGRNWHHISLPYIYRNPAKLVDLQGVSLYIVYFFL